MTRERAVAIAAPLDEERALLIEDLRSAAARAEGAEPGDRLDIIRFETLSSQLEAWAFSYMDCTDAATIYLDTPPSDGPVVVTGGELPGWVPNDRRAEAQSVLDADGALVLIVLPLQPGERGSVTTPRGAPAPAERWRSESGSRGSKAVQERFEFRLHRATSGVAKPEPFSPSGIQNRILTETLRRFVHAPHGSQRVDVPVEYRDGSRAAHPFPLRSVPLLSKAPPATVELSFALLSIRHTELDAIVDGAWLRNSQISQTRTAAETDDLVYSVSREQLQALTNSGSTSVRINMYQTGLETAIVGFYRAVVNHLIEHRGSLTVVPMYYRQRQPTPQGRDQRGHSSRSKNRRPAQRPNEPADTEYSAGEPWTTSRGKTT